MDNDDGSAHSFDVPNGRVAEEKIMQYGGRRWVMSACTCEAVDATTKDEGGKVTAAARTCNHDMCIDSGCRDGSGSADSTEDRVAQLCP